MDWIDIKEIEPYMNILDSSKCLNCEIRTELGREIKATYYEEFGIFIDDWTQEEYGWKDNGENNELVTHWREIN